MNEADIAISHRAEVLGKEVWIKFFLDDINKHQFFMGVITKMETYFPENDTSKPLEYRHFITFGDEDDGYYDLMEQEMTGYLKWTQPEEGEEEEEERGEEGQKGQNEEEKGEDDGDEYKEVTSIKKEPTARAVTPEKPKKKRERSTNEGPTSPAKKIRQVKLEFGKSVSSNITNPSNNHINLPDFEHWLRNIHRSKKNNLLSQQNARSVMNRVRDLVMGKGIGYKNWPENIRFDVGEPVDLNTDFASLLLEAKQFEDTYGEDLGHGWLLRHPIKKLLLYQEYILDKREERANPIQVS